MEEAGIEAGEGRRNAGAYPYVLFAICFLAGVFGGITSTLMSAYLPDVVGELTGITGAGGMEQAGAAINAAFLFGMTFGGLMVGYLSDLWGRKNAVLLSIGCIGVFTLLTAFADHWMLVVGLRFFSGSGLGGILVSTTVIIAEVWTARKKNIALGILSVTIPVGIFATGLITYSFPDWRSGFLFGILPLVLLFIAWFYMKESEEWRLKAARAGAGPKPAGRFFSELDVRDLAYGSAVFGTMLIGVWAVLAWLPTWVQTVVSDTDGQQERGISMMLFAVGGLAGGFASGWISNLIGMRRTMLVCFGATFLLAIALFQFSPALTMLSYVEIVLISAFFGISQGVLNAYIPALFPTSVRSSATGFCFNVGRIFTAAAVFFVGWLVQLLGGYGNAITVFSLTLLIGFLFTLGVRERVLFR